jgi:hypothetical protein
MHLTKQYLLDVATDTWGPNMTEFRKRFVPPEKCNHVQNLFFAYLFVLEAVSKAVPALRAVHFHTGMTEEDARTKVRSPVLLCVDALLCRALKCLSCVSVAEVNGNYWGLD